MFLFIVLNFKVKVDVFALIKFKCCDHSSTKSLIAAVTHCKSSQPTADYKQSLL